MNREENLLAITTRYGPEDGRFAFHRHPSCTYRTHHNSDPNHQESTSSRSRALQAVKRKLNDLDDSLDHPFNKHPRLDNSDANESTTNIDLIGGYQSRFMSLDEDSWENLTGQRQSVFCRTRFGRGGRLKLDFVYK